MDGPPDVLWSNAPTRTEEPTVQYMLLIYPDDQAYSSLSADDQAAVQAEYLALGQRPEVVTGHQLFPAHDARRVRIRDGRTLTTDGPFAETAEVLGGYYLVDVPSEAEAVELAARIPAARLGGTIEVRPVVERRSG